MNAENKAIELRCAQFDREFPHAHENLRTAYLALREAGDSHSTACETIRAEIQMEALKPRGRFDSKQAAANVELENKLKGMA